MISSEDQRFPEHLGFDFEAIQRAIRYNEKSNKGIRGASTISQQTAKNLMLWHGQNWLRKGLEVPATMLLELTWSKKRILEVYLNIAEFGNGILVWKRQVAITLKNQLKIYLKMKPHF